jgi:small subunit ribosomal protein S20
MANLSSAKKWVKQSERRRVGNLARTHILKAATKTTKKLITSKDAKGAGESLAAAYQAIDKAVKRGIIKKNAGDRKKSRLAKAIAKI